MIDLAQRLEHRYGTPGPARRPLIITGVAVLATAGLGWLIWAMLLHGRPLVQSQMISYAVNGEHASHARLTVVRRTENVEAICLLRAIAADHSIVGELNFTIDASSPATLTLDKVIRTERKATSVDLMGCVSDGQKQRR